MTQKQLRKLAATRGLQMAQRVFAALPADGKVRMTREELAALLGVAFELGYEAARRRARKC